MALVVKNPAANEEDMRPGFNSWVGKIPWRREWQPTPVLLPGESHGQRNLVGYSPQDSKDADMTESTCHTHTHTQIIFSISLAAAAAAKSLQLCPTLWDPTDGSPPGSPIPGILQARILEWVAITFSNAWKWKVKGKSLSHVRLLAIPWTATFQAPPSMGFYRQVYWSGVPLPSLQCLPYRYINLIHRWFYL